MLHVGVMEHLNFVDVSSDLREHVLDLAQLAPKRGRCRSRLGDEAIDELALLLEPVLDFVVEFHEHVATRKQVAVVFDAHMQSRPLLVDRVNTLSQLLFASARLLLLYTVHFLERSLYDRFPSIDILCTYLCM